MKFKLSRTILIVVVILATITAPFGAAAASKPKIAARLKPKPLPMTSRLIPISEQFNRKPVQCLEVSPGSFVAGFISTRRGKQSWNNVAHYVYDLIKARGVKAARKLKAQGKLANNSCKQLVTRCALVATPLTVPVFENTPTRFVIPPPLSVGRCALTSRTTRMRDPLHGTIEQQGAQFIYTPDLHSLRNDSFEFRVSNDLTNSATAQVTFMLQQGRADFAGVSTSLLPYRDQLTEAEVNALLDKVAFGGNPALREVRSLNTLVSLLLDPQEDPDTLGTLALANSARLERIGRTDTNSRFRYPDLYQDSLVSLRYGNPMLNWMRYIVWANHFAIDTSDYSNSDHSSEMTGFYARLRRNALGNFEDLLKDLFTSLPFHTFLNNFDNEIAPNQNFAREYMELFTAGTYDPITAARNYTENDVIAATQYLAGWYFGGRSLGFQGVRAGVVPTPIGFWASDDDAYFSSAAETCAGQTRNKISLSWLAQFPANGVSNPNGVRNVRVFRAPRGSSSFVQIAELWGGASSYEDINGCSNPNPPLPGVVYDYRIQFVAGNGGSLVGPVSATDSGYFMNLGATTPVLPAVPPAQTASKNESEQIRLNWGAVSGAVQYRIYRSPYNQNRAEQLLATVPATQLSFIDRSALLGEPYLYYVRSVNSAGLLSARSGFGRNEVDVVYGITSIQSVDLRSPRRVTVTQGSDLGGVAISWETVPGAATYRVYKSPQWLSHPYFLGETSSTSLVDTSAGAGQVWEYYVISRAADGAIGRLNSQATFVPTRWSSNSDSFPKKPFLADLPDSDLNASARIRGRTVNGAYEGEALTAFGETFPGKPTVPSFVDHTLYNWPATSRHLAAKLFAQLVHRNLSEELVSELSQDLIANRYNLQPVLRKLLTSSAMFSPEANRTCVANPTEVLIKFMRRSELPLGAPGTLYNLDQTLTQAGHRVYVPPSIFGFQDCGVVRGGEIHDGGAWTLSAQTYIALGNGLSQYLRYVEYASGENGGEATDLTNHFAPADKVSSPEQLVDRTATKLNLSLTPAQRQILINYLNTNYDGTFSRWNRSQEDRLYGLLRLMTLTLNNLSK